MKFFTILFLLISCSGFSQTLKVLHYSDLSPIDQVLITSSRGGHVYTNPKGEADISTFSQKDTLILEKFGFETMKITVEDLASYKFTIYLKEEILELDAVVISANKFEEEKKEVPRQIEVISSKEMKFMNQSTTADVLQESGSVFVQKSQMGGGSPVLRGFEANKVLLVVDGVRMNNAIYRGGHLQNVITLDHSILEKAEVVFGSSSVVYGSDALGGVMHFVTKDPKLSGKAKKSFISGSAYSRYASANSGKTAHADLNIGFHKIGFLSSVTFSDFDDLRQGSRRSSAYPDFGKRFFYVTGSGETDTVLPNKNYDVQKFSGYQQLDLLQKVMYRQNSRLSHLLNFQYSTSSDIPRYDRLALTRNNNPRFSEWYYGPQRRLFLSYSAIVSGHKKFFNRAKLIAAFQDVKESRHDREYKSPILNNRFEDVKVYSLNLDFTAEVRKHEFRYGLEGILNQVTSQAHALDLKTGEQGPLDTRYSDGGSTMQMAGAYFSHAYELSDKWIFNEGLRLNYVSLHSELKDTSFFSFPFNKITQRNFSFNGNAGLVYLPSSDWKFSLLASTGFRAPNVDDLGKIFESVPGRVIIPNPDLKPEYTYNLDLSAARYINQKFGISATFYYTIYENIITLTSASYEGEDSIFYNGQLSQVQVSDNKDQAFILGFSGKVFSEINKFLYAYATFNYTYGRIQTDSIPYPIDHIPPVFGKISFQFKMKKIKAETYMRYNGWKRKQDYNLVGEDNFSQATEDGMPSWYTLNLKFSWAVTKNLELLGGVENMLDRNYRVFGSGISAPGRNFIVSLKGSF